MSDAHVETAIDKLFGDQRGGLAIILDTQDFGAHGSFPAHESQPTRRRRWIDATTLSKHNEKIYFGDCDESQRRMTLIQAPTRLKHRYDFYIF